MAEVNICISKESPGTGLVLTICSSGQPAGTVSVHRGDTVIWKLEPTGGITSISAIVDTSSDGNDIFSVNNGGVEPHSFGDDGSWKGTVGNTANGNESYCIHYYIGSQLYQHDPELDIHA